MKIWNGLKLMCLALTILSTAPSTRAQNAADADKEKKEESKSDEYKTIRREFSYKSFKRSFAVDQKIDASNIQAKYENGVLKLLLPKKEESKDAVKQINID